MKDLMAKSLMDRKLKLCDRVTEQCVNQSGTAENGSEHAACQVKVQKKVVTIWLFDTGADAHVYAEVCVGTVGRICTANKNVTLRGANEQDLGAMGEVQVRGFIGKIRVQFTAVVARDARRCLLSGTQLRTKGYTFFLFESTRKFPRSTERRPKSDNVTRRKQRHTQSCMSLETKRDTVGNLHDVVGT